MPSMVSHPRRQKSGHFTCYLNRTYHLLTTHRFPPIDGAAGSVLICAYTGKEVVG
jgi:hypothetical protein